MISLLSSLAESESMEAEASMLGSAANYANAMKHYGCRRKGGCSSGCPYISTDDSRLAIASITGSIDNVYKFATESALSYDARKEVTLALFGQAKQDSLRGEMQVKNVMIHFALDGNINCQAVATQLRKLYAAAESVPVDVLNAKNTTDALEAAAIIYKNVLSDAIMVNEATMMCQRMELYNSTKFAHFDELKLLR